MIYTKQGWYNFVLYFMYIKVSVFLVLGYKQGIKQLMYIFCVLGLNFQLILVASATTSLSSFLMWDGIHWLHALTLLSFHSKNDSIDPPKC